MKKYILKYLSFLLVIMVLVQLPVQATERLYTDKEKQQYTDASQLLIKLGILDEYKDITTTVTRAEYARVLVSLSIGGALTGGNINATFTDVDKETKYIEYIHLGAEMGLLMGYGDGTFRPDNMVKTEEAITGLVKVLGYEDYAEKAGGYPRGFISMAQEIDLLNGTSVYIGYDITYGLLVRLVMNALDVEILNPINDADNKIQYDRGENIIANRLGVEKRTGILEANGKSSLYSETAVAKNSVTINGKDYIVNKDYNDLLGYCVEYYVDIKDGETIIYLNKKAEKNEELTVCSKDIENYLDREYKYNDNGKIKKLHLENNTAIIYNGVCETEPTAQMMWPQNGWITLVDNNGDGDYDVLSITEYETYVIYFVDAVNKKVYDMFDSSKVLSFDDNEFSIEDAEGKQKDFENLRKWNILSVKQSVNKVVTEIIVCEESIRGTVQRFADDEIVISGISYEFSQDFANSGVQLGKNGTFFIDAFGRIVAMSDTLGDGMELGYLIEARLVDYDEEMVKLKMCDSTGRIVVLYTAKKVSMDNVTRVAPQVIISNLQKGTPEILPQPIMVGYDEEGKVNKIDTPYNNKPVNSGDIFSVIPENGEKQDSFRIVYPSGTMTYRSAQKTFDGKINLTDATVIYSVPETITDSNDDYKVVGAGSLRGDQQYNCEFYSLGENNSYADICVVKGRNSVDATTRYGVVTSIKHALDNDDEPVNEIRFTDFGGSMVGKAYDSEMIDIDKGDFVEFTINREDEIVSMRRVYDESSKMFELTNPTSTIFNEPNRLLLGYVYSKENNIISITKDPITGTVNRTDLENHTADKYKCYMYENDSLREIMPEEVLDYKHTGNSGSKVVIYTYYGEPRILVVYK